MKKTVYFLLFLTQASFTGFGQNAPPGIAWQKTVGGNGAEVLTGMCVSADKSVVLCGYSNSGTSGYKTSNPVGGYDYWVVKLDTAGNVLWNKTFGGSKNDFAAAVIATADGGYLVGGTSISNKSGVKSSNSYGLSTDYWVLKLDAGGNIQWDKTMGGLFTDKLTALAQLPNGKYVVGGYAYSKNTGTKTSSNLGTESNADYWTIVLNTDGTEASQRVFGGGSHDVLTCIAPYGVNSYYAAGYSYSSKRAGYKSQIGYGNNDFYFARHNLGTGKVDFQGDFGGKLSDYLTCMQVLPDNSLIFGGYSNSYKSNSKKEASKGITDFWLLKLNKDGTKQWDKTIGGLAVDGLGADYLISVQQTSDKGFILGGYSNAQAGNNKTENSRGGFDYWIVKTDSLGKVQWNKTIGGTGDDILTAVYETAPNEYIIAGTSGSNQSGDKTNANVGSGSTDYWVVRLGATQAVSAVAATNAVQANTTAAHHNYSLEIMPNPVRDKLTIRYVAVAGSKLSFVVYAANGNSVLQATLTGGGAESMRSFNVANLPSGSYFAVLYVNGVKLTKAFTKE